MPTLEGVGTTLYEMIQNIIRCISTFTMRHHQVYLESIYYLEGEFKIAEFRATSDAFSHLA